MYRTSSTLSNFEDNNKVLPKKSKIVMLAKTDLFAECLTQAISTRFQDQDIVSLSDADDLLDGNLGADRQEDCEDENGDSGDPVAFLPQTHWFHTKWSRADDDKIAQKTAAP